MVNKSGSVCVMIECLKNLSGDSEMTVMAVHEWKMDDRYIQQARGGWNFTDGSAVLETGVILQTNKIQCWHGMRIKPEKPYNVRLERLYSSNDLGAFLDILSITLSFFLGFVLLSVVVVLLRSWLYY